MTSADYKVNLWNNRPEHSAFILLQLKYIQIRTTTTIEKPNISSTILQLNPVIANFK